MPIGKSIAALAAVLAAACASTLDPSAPGLDATQSVLKLTAVDFAGNHVQGTAFVYDAQRGLILTAPQFGHERVAYTTSIPNDATVHPALVGKSEKFGFTLLSIGQPIDVPELDLSRTRPRAGDPATIVGVASNATPMETIRLPTQISNASLANRETDPEAVSFLQLDVRLPTQLLGGAPVVNQEGEVIGIIAATVTDAAAAQLGQATFASATYQLETEIEAMLRAAAAQATDTQ